MTRHPALMRFLGALALVFTAAAVQAETPDYKEVAIECRPLSASVHMLTGSGGNMAVCTGEDGAFLVDDQFAPLTDKITAAVRAIDKSEIRFVFNTHWHHDHVGGNANLGAAGAVIFAHENVRRRMATEQFMSFFNTRVPAAVKAALPVVTFSTDLTLHLNGEEIHIFHIENAHTDGDAVVHFKTSNVLHTGDIYFAGIYPFIDTDADGSIDGMIRAVDRLLPLIDSDTKVIPGHGPLSDKAGLFAYRQMLARIRDNIAPMVAAGKSLAEIQAAKPTGTDDSIWGNGFLSPESFVRIVVTGMNKR